jgi:MFS family permease
MGANNLQIGLLAATPSITQLLQIAAVLLIEKLRRRKAICVLTWFPAQLLWFPIAAIPFLFPTPSPLAVSLLLAIMVVRGLLSAVTNCSWNTWISDLVPKDILGNFFARRSILSTIATVIFGLGGAFFVDFWGDRNSGRLALEGYSYVIAFGALFMGLMSPFFMSLMPEPPMREPAARLPLGQMLVSPVRDKNFRWLLAFFLGWSFASNLAVPFFSVYMLQHVGLSVSTVVALFVLSQLFSILFLRVWGSLIDKYGNKVILSLSTSLYLLVIFGWIFTLTPDRHFLTIPLLIALHIFAGIAGAGVGLATSTIGLKIAPASQATAYLSSISLSLNIGAGLGPMAGGLLADFFSQRHLNLVFTWASPTESMQIQALSITGFAFLFAIAFFLGILTISLLANLREEGETSRDVVLETLINPIRELYRPVSWGLPYPLAHGNLYKYLKRIPLPGLDVAFSVLAYQVADFVNLSLDGLKWALKNSRKFFRNLLSSDIKTKY